jgi:hypothetical protein
MNDDHEVGKEAEQEAPLATDRRGFFKSVALRSAAWWRE